MEETSPETMGGIAGMTLRELCEAASDTEIRLAAASVAAACAAMGAALLSRASCTFDPEAASTRDSACSRARQLSAELQELATRLDAADEFVHSSGDKPGDAALSVASDACLALLEASYFGQSLALQAAEGAKREGAMDLAGASMMLDAAAGSSLICASFYLAGITDADAVRRSEELIWAITHDRVGAKKKVLDASDKLIRNQDLNILVK